MHQIISPLQLGSHGPEVANLQDALLLLIDKGIIQMSEADRQTLKSLLSQEKQVQSYTDGTAKAVQLFQGQHQLERTGTVDGPTADALNQFLKDLGAFDPAQNGQKQMVAGQVAQDDHTPFKGTVILFYEGAQGSIRRGEDTTDPEGRYTIGYDSALGLDGARLRIAAFDPDGKQRADATITDAKPVEIVNLIVSREAPVYRVEGRVASRSRAGVGGLRVQIVDKNVGVDVPLATVPTADDGSYRVSFPYAGTKQNPDLQARVLSGETFLDASEVRYNASQHETLNILVEEKANDALVSEHETLLGALSPHLPGSLGDLQETDDRQDITYLANKTGWDARLVATEALAVQFSDRTAAAGGASTIAPAFFYALFRAGLPANEDALYQVDAKTAAAIWKQGIEQGVIPAALADSIPEAAKHFQGLAAQRALDVPALSGVSSLKQMLLISLGEDPDPERQHAKEMQFADLYTQHRDNPSQFWDAVRGVFGEAAEKRCKFDG